jgi:hypothetical protein
MQYSCQLEALTKKENPTEIAGGLFLRLEIDTASSGSRERSGSDHGSATRSIIIETSPAPLRYTTSCGALVASGSAVNEKSVQVEHYSDFASTARGTWVARLTFGGSQPCRTAESAILMGDVEAIRRR